MLGFHILRGKKARPSIGTPQFKSKSPAVYPLDRRFYEGVWGFRYAAFPPGITLRDLRSFLIQTIQVESDALTWIVVVSLSVSDASKQGECLCPLVIKGPLLPIHAQFRFEFLGGIQGGLDEKLVASTVFLGWFCCMVG